MEKLIDKTKLFELINGMYNIPLHKVIDFVKEIDVVEKEEDAKYLEDRFRRIKGRIKALEGSKVRTGYLFEEDLDELFKEDIMYGTLNCGICCNKFDSNELKHYYIELDKSNSGNDYDYWYHNSYEIKDYGFNSNCVALCNGCYSINETNYHFGIDKGFKNFNLRKYIIALLKIPKHIPDSQVDDYLNLHT